MVQNVKCVFKILQDYNLSGSLSESGRFPPLLKKLGTLLWKWNLKLIFQHKPLLVEVWGNGNQMNSSKCIVSTWFHDPQTQMSWPLLTPPWTLPPRPGPFSTRPGPSSANPGNTSAPCCLLHAVIFNPVAPFESYLRHEFQRPLRHYHEQNFPELPVAYDYIYMSSTSWWFSMHCNALFSSILNKLKVRMS